MFETLKSFLANNTSVNVADVTMDSELSGDLGINSLELADLVYACEQEFDIEIADEDLHTFVTVGDVVRYLENNVK